MGYRGKIADAEPSPGPAGPGLDATARSPPSSACQPAARCRSGCRDVEFDRRGPRPTERRQHGERPNKPPSGAKLPRSSELQAEGDRAHRPAERARVPRRRRGPLRRARAPRRQRQVRFANTDPRMILFFVTWLRRFFDDRRVAAPSAASTCTRASISTRRIEFWSELTGIPPAQFGKPYRAVADPSIRSAKHPLRLPGGRLLLHAGPIERSWA